MAAYDDRHGVRADRTADRPGRAGLADGCRKRAIGYRLAPAETLELGPHRLLERCADEPYRHVELGAGACEVLEELLTRVLEHFVRALGLVVVGEHAVALDAEADDGDVVADELDAPDGALEPGEEHVGHASRVAAASDIDSRESDIAERSP